MQVRRKAEVGKTSRSWSRELAREGPCWKSSREAWMWKMKETIFWGRCFAMRLSWGGVSFGSEWEA